MADPKAAKAKRAATAATAATANGAAASPATAATAGGRTTRGTAGAKVATTQVRHGCRLPLNDPPRVSFTLLRLLSNTIVWSGKLTLRLSLLQHWALSICASCLHVAPLQLQQAAMLCCPTPVHTCSLMQIHPMQIGGSRTDVSCAHSLSAGACWQAWTSCQGSCR